MSAELVRGHWHMFALYSDKGNQGNKLIGESRQEWDEEDELEYRTWQW